MSINQSERASRAWPILAECAREGRTITYGHLGMLLGVHHRAIRYVLSLIQDYCLEHRLPPLTILVVDQNGKPGSGFIAYENDKLEQGMALVFAHSWKATSNPFASEELRTNLPNILSIASKLNELAGRHSIGNLQMIRRRLKRSNRQSGNKIFTAQTTFADWAFHHGGRTELQFNIGLEDRDNKPELRAGVAFSFELSQSLKSIEVLVPKVKLFNDFMESNSRDFDDMRMWHYDPRRSHEYAPGLIPSMLVREGAFVFLGRRHPSTQIDYDKILDDFDRLLPLFEFVESGGSTSPVPLLRTAFNFKPGFSSRVTTAAVTLVERELEVDLRHNHLQECLYHRLTAGYGEENVRAEQPSGIGTQIDIVVKQEDDYWFYEIKTALTARACLREAIGQLLEYGLWPGSKEPTRFIVVGERPADMDGQEYLRRLRKRFSMPIEYESIVV